jgi:hypothetical protein
VGGRRPNRLGRRISGPICHGSSDLVFDHVEPTRRVAVGSAGDRFFIEQPLVIDMVYVCH